ncbi:MAG: transcriptional regulator GcvA [Alphaproteobacteria bacterium]|nr:transcriptional regulator GcvA [Alphaproteobacteria bacterium]
MHRKRRRRLPPLDALRVFEAAARLGSFTKAADELAVTQAAVSHRMRQLEDWLGLALFRRVNRQVALTEAGQVYQRRVARALDELWAATDEVLLRQARGLLTVSVLPSFAAKWLVPRLGDFRRAHPEIDVRIDAKPELVDFQRHEVDLAIRFGAGTWPGVLAIRFLTEDRFPVCSPKLLTGERPLGQPADLAQHVLLHDDDWHEDWRSWLKAAGATDIDASRGPAMNDSSLVLQAAIDGQGVALARGALAEADLAVGRLVRPSAFVLPAQFAYFLVAPAPAFRQPKIAAFADWVLATVGLPPLAMLLEPGPMP